MDVVYHNETMISLNTEDSMAIRDDPVGPVFARPTLLTLINYYYYCIIGSWVWLYVKHVCTIHGFKFSICLITNKNVVIPSKPH